MAAGISMLGSIVALLFLRKRFAWYQFALLFSFLIGLTSSGELDITLPVLVVFSLAPYVFGVSKIGSIPLVFICISSAYLFFGFAFQSPTASLVTFLARLMQFISFYLILDNVSLAVKRLPGVSLIVVATLVESLIGFYLVKNGSMAAGIEMEGIRLVSNSQPITGNVAIAVMPFAGYLYFSEKLKKSDKPVFAVCLVILAIWVILSGTRGYILVYGATLALIVCDFFFVKKKSRQSAAISILVFCFMALACLFAIALFQDQLAEKIDSALRLGDSLGIRGSENQIAVSFFAAEDPVGKLFGIGIGGTWADHPEYADAVHSIFGFSGLASRYLGRVGTNFHNFYANIACLQGLVGIAAIVLVFAGIIAKVVSYCSSNLKLKLFLTSYVLMFALMLYFRWSADCGIVEFVILAYVLNLTKCDERENNPASSLQAIRED